MTRWFPGEGRNADDEAFLSELRALTDASGLADVPSAATGVSIWRDPADRGWLVAWVRVPGLPEDADVQLQVGFDVSNPEVESLVACWETHGYLLDQWEAQSVPVQDPGAMAHQAFVWFQQQLRRPVVRLDFPRRWRSEVSEWRLADSGQVLWADPVFRQPKGEGRVTRLR